MRFLLPLAVAAMALAAPARASAPCPVSRGDAILTIDGQIGCASAAQAATFDLETLAALDPVTIRTSTMWTEGVHSFTGVPLARLLDAVAARGSAVRAHAINEYAVQIPREDWIEGGPIVAYLTDGAPMTLRDKGPLWIVYPWDSRPDYKNEATYARSIWQLDRIEVLD